MSDQKIVLLAHFRAKSGKARELRQAAHSMLTVTRSEPGCLKYDLHENADTEGSFMFYEIWADKDALDRHKETEHLKRFLELAEKIAEPMEATWWKQIEEIKTGV